MKKYFLAILGIMVALSFSSGAGAITVGETYYGGTVVNYPVLNDVIGGTDFSVDSLVATKGTDGRITVVLTGSYFLSGYAAGLWGLGQPGDLYISSTGWRMVSPANNGAYDTFVPSLEGWDYVISFADKKLYSFSTSGQAYTPTGNEGYWYGYRDGQAYRGGYVGNGTAATVTLSGNTLTFIFDSMGLDPAQIGYHWAMGCGNDVVEGGGTPVPEPGTLFLLGLGFVGLVVSRLRK
jgi:hypothetical protein